MGLTYIIAMNLTQCAIAHIEIVRVGEHAQVMMMVKIKMGHTSRVTELQQRQCQLPGRCLSRPVYQSISMAITLVHPRLGGIRRSHN